MEESLPFGAGALDESPSTAKGGKKKAKKKTARKATKKVEASPSEEPQAAEKPSPPKRTKRTPDESGAPPRRRARGASSEEGESAPKARGESEKPSAAEGERETRSPRSEEAGGSRPEGEGGGGRGDRKRRWQERRRKKRKRRGGSGGGSQEGGQREQGGQGPQREQGGQGGQREQGGQGRRRQESRGSEERGGGSAEPIPTDGILVLEQANHGHLRHKDKGYMPSRDDVHVSPRLVQKFSLRDGARIVGTVRRGQGRHKWDLADVQTVDGKPPGEQRNLPVFKSLRSIDPDFHYAVGDGSGEVSLKVVDCLCPVGRGQRGLIVAPPRSGKTILMQQFAHAIEKIYPEVHLMVLLLDERPEEATEWKRSLDKGEVFVSTNDETAKKHVELAEVVWRRCKRLVEMGEDVILLLDSITRMGRAYNNVKGNSGKTMSGGIDTRALERPKQFFGAARNTETAGSLTILATALVQTGSRMDQVIFEEFKGTGNMELVLSRKLADRRIFPAIDIEKTGTRKDEKLHSTQRLHRVNVLRRVLMRMHWAEAIELLVTKLDEVEKIDDFLKRFDADPDVD